MQARDLTHDHDGMVCRIADTGVVVRVDGSVVGDDAVLIKDGQHTWTIAAETELDVIA